MFENLLNPATIGAGAGYYFGGPMGSMIGSQIGGSMMARQGAQEANKANQRLSREQMAFQERMSSTAHQRQTADLKKAGLNPVLSANTGASSPSGSMATMQNTEAQTVQAAQNAASTALQARRLGQDLKNLKAQEKQINAQTRKTTTENTLLEANKPAAELKNQAGRYIQQMVEGASSSVKNISKDYKARQKKLKSKTYKPKTNKKTKSKTQWEDKMVYPLLH